MRIILTTDCPETIALEDVSENTVVIGLFCLPHVGRKEVRLLKHLPYKRGYLWLSLSSMGSQSSLPKKDLETALTDHCYSQLMAFESMSELIAWLAEHPDVRW